MDADGNEDGVGADHPAHTHLLIPGVQDEIEVGFIQTAFGELGQGFVGT